jgi:ammonia channel protein AmtB
MSNPYHTCLSVGEAGNAESLARCLAEETGGSLQNPVVGMLLFFASLVIFMQAGFAMICAGAVRKKNVQNTVLKNFLDMCGSAIAFYTVGYAFAYGDNEESSSGGVTFIGTSNFLLLGMTEDESGIEYSLWIFQFAFAATSGKILFYFTITIFL